MVILSMYEHLRKRTSSFLFLLLETLVLLSFSELSLLIYYLLVSVSQEHISGDSCAQVLTRQQTKCWPHHVPFLSLGFSFKLTWLLLEFSSLQLWVWGPCFLADCWQGPLPAPKKLPSIPYQKYSHRPHQNMAAY